VTTLLNVTDNSFDPHVLKCDIPVLANFWAEWSVSCQPIIVQLEELAAEHPEQVKVVNVEIEANPTVTSGYGVLNIPTLILFKNGQELTRLSGAQTKQSILDTIIPYFDTSYR